MQTEDDAPLRDEDAPDYDQLRQAAKATRDRLVQLWEGLVINKVPDDRLMDLVRTLNMSATALRDLRRLEEP